MCTFILVDDVGPWVLWVIVLRHRHKAFLGTPRDSLEASAHSFASQFDSYSYIWGLCVNGVGISFLRVAEGL